MPWDCGLDVIRLRCVPIVLVEGLELLDALSVSDWSLSLLVSKSASETTISPLNAIEEESLFTFLSS